MSSSDRDMYNCTTWNVCWRMDKPLTVFSANQRASFPLPFKYTQEMFGGNLGNYHISTFILLKYWKLISVRTMNIQKALKDYYFDFSKILKIIFRCDSFSGHITMTVWLVTLCLKRLNSNERWKKEEVWHAHITFKLYTVWVRSGSLVVWGYIGFLVPSLAFPTPLSPYPSNKYLRNQLL